MASVEFRIGSLALRHHREDFVLKEFKEFAVKGNVIDLAVALVIGAAFGAVVKSLVDDVIMPPFGFLLGGADFNSYYFLLKAGPKEPGPYLTLAEAIKAGAVTWRYGMFVNSIVTFLIVSFTMFLVVKYVLKAKKIEAPPVPTVSAEVALLTEIRDALKNRQ
jgi:large conductance mechanosensitive channel